jgi:hypothetical protein
MLEIASTIGAEGVILTHEVEADLQNLLGPPARLLAYLQNRVQFVIESYGVLEI